MNEVTLASFLDELEKIALSVGQVSSTVKALKPAPISTGSKIKTTLKPGKATTNYSNVNTQIPEAAYGTATGSKSVPPPPVRT